MLSKKELLKSPEYWQDVVQNEVYRQAKLFMEKNNMNQIQLANHLGVTKGYVSQILAGDCNFSLKKLIEFSLKLGLRPSIRFESFDDPEEQSGTIEYSYRQHSDNTEYITAAEPKVKYKKAGAKNKK